MSRASVENRDRSLQAFAEGENPWITIDLNLPKPVDPRRLGIRESRALSMMRFGGVRKITFVGDTLSDSNPSIGENPDRQPYGGLRAQNPREIFTYAVDLEPSNSGSPTPQFLAGRWVDATVRVDVDRVKKMLVSSRRPPEEAWGRALDRLTRRAVLDAGIGHVVFDSTVHDMWQLAQGTVWSTAPGLVFQFTHTDNWFTESVGAFTLSHALFNMLNRYDYSRGGYGKGGYRWSFFAGPQFDRALVLKGMSTIPGLVHALPQSR